MNQKIISIVLGLFVLMASSCSKDEAKPKLIADFKVTYAADFQNFIYPSLIFGLTEIEKQQGKPMEYFTIKVNPNIETDIKIVIQESKVNYETIITESSVKGEKNIIPSVKWKYDELKNLTQPGNVDMTFVCYGNDNVEIGRENLKLGYRAINECVYGLIDGDDYINLSNMFAAYVNEDSPVIDEFLNEVLQSQGLSGFVGYQLGETGVANQVRACFLTLRSMGVKYSSITNTSNSSNPKIISQYIRFSDEVLNNSQANCADGTVFFCSVLKKIGIHPLMIFIPGHVYLGYYNDDSKTSIRLLETTMVGTKATFEQATDYNVEAYKANLVKLINDDFSDGYVMLDIDKAREKIKPIGR